MGSRPGCVIAGFAVGSLPFSQWAARLFAGSDLRRVGSGTVSGSGLYEVAGFGPLALAGVLDVARGAVGPLLAGRDRRRLAAAATAATVSGHNWSPWLSGAGGRGLSPALGAMAVSAPEGTMLLAAAMAAGRLARQSGVATLAATCGLVGFSRGADRQGLLSAWRSRCPWSPSDWLAMGPGAGGDRLAVAWSRLWFDCDPLPG